MTTAVSGKLRVSIRREGAGAAVIRFSGELDANSVRTCREKCYAVVDSGTPFVVADLTDLSLIDSAGIALLMGLLKRARQYGGSFQLVQPARFAVRQILQVTRLDLVFESAESVDDALKRQPH